MMQNDDWVDPYLDPKTGLLKNNFNAQTQEELSEIEGDFASIGAIRFIASKPKITFAAAFLRKTHKSLFGKVYPWAGEFRTIEISKPDGEWFLASPAINTGLEYTFGELAKDNFFKNASEADIPKILAKHYDNLNYVHPFREGNGRTQRMFWSLALNQAGFQIDWRRISAEENDYASELAREKNDTSALVDMFTKSVHKTKNRNIDELIENISPTLSHVSNIEQMPSS